MRLHLLFATLFAVVFFKGSTAFAQLDPSSALLLNGGSHVGTKDSGVGSGRYTVRPKAEMHNSPAKQNDNDDVDDSDESGPVAGPIVVPPSTAPTATPVPVSVQTPAPVAAPVSIQTSAPTMTETREVDDRKLTMLELKIGSGYMYNNSSSSYTYRNYNSEAPLFDLEAIVWFSPYFAIQTSYLGTMSAHVSDSLDGQSNVSAPQQWFTTGFRSRQFFGNSRLAPTMTFGIDYSEYQFRAPSDSQLREQLSSTGIKLSLESEIPVDGYRSWLLQFVLSPKLQHAERKTAIEFSSGSDVDANSVGISLGQKIGLDRSSAMYWKITHTIENDVFSGSASQEDPLTHNTPSGVNVTNSWTMLLFGYSWGD